MDTRDRILIALEEIITTTDPFHFSIEDVAKKAGVSKGGLLYHFPTKDELLKSLLDKVTDEQFEAIEKEAENFKDTPSRLLKAQVRAWIHQLREKGKLFPAILSIINHNREFLEPLKIRFNELRRHHIENGLDPITVNIILLAIDGYLFHRSLEVEEFTEEEATAIENQLIKMCEMTEK
ncbi:MAG: TetR/AcrR family transcriptional regulator [Spirochaetota bacterium]